MTPHPNGIADELLLAWGRGWAASRGTPPPVPLVDGGWRIEVGLPGHRRRDLLPAWPAKRLLTWAEGVTAPGHWIKALIDPAELQLPPAWRVQATEYLMSTTLRPETVPALARGYHAELIEQGNTLDCHLRTASGEMAARARVGLAGRYAVFDQVVTEPAHRRLGLGRNAMAQLAEAARARGAHTGLLVATEDGRALYTALGWRVDSLMAAATVAEPG